MRIILYAAILLILVSCGSEKRDERIDAIDKFLQGQAEHFRFNGNVLVAEKGKVIYQKSFGVADYYSQRALNDTSVFELASVSKQFTAMGILILEKQGKLKLTDSLRQYFPELPYKNITIHHLLTHTSGLPDYEEVMESKWDKSKIAFNSDLINVLAKEKPAIRFQPGARCAYSNTGYVFLASIVEKVSGMTFQDFMAKNIFGPLAMDHSRVYNTRRTGEVIDNYAYGFVWSDSLHQFVLPDSLPDYYFVRTLDGIQGDGIINSTTGDLLKWERGLVNGTLIGDAVQNKMMHPHALFDTTAKSYYGYGVFVGKNQLGNYWNHTGGWPGYATNLARYVDDDNTIIVLSNNASNAPAIQGAIAYLLFNKTVVPPYQHKAITLDSTALGLFTGSYSIKGRKFDIRIENDTLVEVLSPSYSKKLIPESVSKIFRINNEDVQFEVVDSSNTKKYYRIIYGVKQEMEKLK
jgi:CubicO group peptidase (beta-lactamase class C family)